MFGELTDACHMRDPRFISIATTPTMAVTIPHGVLSLLSRRGQVPAGGEPARDPRQVRRPLRLPLGSLVLRGPLFARHTRRLQHRHHGNARLRIDAWISLKCLVSAGDADFNRDESKCAQRPIRKRARRRTCGATHRGAGRLCAFARSCCCGRQRRSRDCGRRHPSQIEGEEINDPT
jgi:hypothetical protein